jgi:hypothetical protein
MIEGGNSISTPPRCDRVAIVASTRRLIVTGIFPTKLVFMKKILGFDFYISSGPIWIVSDLVNWRSSVLENDATALNLAIEKTSTNRTG